MPIKRLDPRQQLLVVAQRDQHLGLVPDRLLEDREGALGNLVFLQLANLGFVELGLGDVDVLTGGESGGPQERAGAGDV
jgi:hypothetical protein